MSMRGGEMLFSLNYSMPATRHFRTSNILQTKKVLRLFVSMKKETNLYAFLQRLIITSSSVYRGWDDNM